MEVFSSLDWTLKDIEISSLCESPYEETTDHNLCRYFTVSMCRHMDVSLINKVHTMPKTL